MARMNRSATTAQWHHVMNRGARKLPVFGDNADRRRFLFELSRAVSSLDVEVHAYALMDNHYHLLLHTDVGGLSATMKAVGANYTQSFNAKYGLDGSLFRGRFRSKPILDESYLQHVVRYVHRNPLEVNGSYGGASFRWTSHPVYIGDTTAPAWLQTERLLALLGGREAYRSFVEGPDGAAESPTRTPLPALARPFRFSDVDQAIGIASPMEYALVHQGGRSIRNPARLVALLLCREFSAATAGELAERYGYGSPSSASSALSRARQRCQSDADFAAMVADARRRLLARLRLPNGGAADAGGV